MKAVLVANADGKRLYYIVDSKTRTGDGVIATNSTDAKLVDFWPTVKSAEKLIPITNTEFHRFLWSEGVGQDKEHWHSCFVAKRAEVGENLLSSVVIRTDVFNKKAKFNEITNRAFEFKSGIYSPNEKGILKRLGARLGGNLQQATGGVRGFKLGEVFDPKAIDADGDGFVQEGTQFARVASNSIVNASTPDGIPVERTAAEIIADTENAQKKTLIPSESYQFYSDPAKQPVRWIDRGRTVIKSEFDLQEAHINKTFNNGNTIETAGDARQVLSQLGDIKIDFLKNSPGSRSHVPDDKKLSLYEQQLVYGIAHSLDVAPQLQNVKIRVSENPPGDESGGSQVLIPGFSVKFTNDPATDYITSGSAISDPHYHMIRYTPEGSDTSSLTVTRPGGYKFNLTYDISSMKVAAAYLFDDDKDPDYNEFKKIAARIEREAAKSQRSEKEVFESLPKQLQDEYKLLNAVFARKLEADYQKSPKDVAGKIKEAEAAVIRSIMYHEFGHASWFERSYQDALDGAEKTKVAHIAKYESIHARLDEIAGLVKTATAEERQSLIDEAAQLSSELKSEKLTSVQDLNNLKKLSGESLIPFYSYKISHGLGDKKAEQSIASELLDEHYSGHFLGIMSLLHNQFSPQGATTGWVMEYANEVIRSMPDQQSRDQAIHSLKNIFTPIANARSKPIYDESGREIKMTLQMRQLLDDAISPRGKITRRIGPGIADYNAENRENVPDTRVGEPLKLQDLADIVFYSDVLSSGIDKLHPEVGPNPQPLQGIDSLQDAKVDLARKMQNNFSHIELPSDQRQSLVSAIRRIGILQEKTAAENNLPSSRSVAILPLTDPRAAGMQREFAATTEFNRLAEILPYFDLKPGITVTDPTDTLGGSSKVIDDYMESGYSMLSDSLLSLDPNFPRSQIERGLAAHVMFTTIQKHGYDNLTRDEKRIAEHLSKYGSGSDRAAYMAFVQRAPLTAAVGTELGDMRVELWSELATINALRMTIWSGGIDDSGKIASRQLNKREMEVLEKLISWYQPKAKFQLGMTPPLQERRKYVK